MAESAVVAVDFKRMKNMKNTHLSGCIRPVKMTKTIAFLKDKGNPYYKDVIITCMFCPHTFKHDDTELLDPIKQIYLNTQANESEKEVEDTKNKDDT